MNTTTVLEFIVMIGLVFFLIGLFVSNINNSYQTVNDNEINQSLWQGKYDYNEEVNQSLGNVKEKFDKITDSETGFFTKLTAGISIPFAVLMLPALIFDSLKNLTSFAVDALAILGIPPYIMVIVSILFMIWIIKRLLEYFSGGQT